LCVRVCAYVRACMRVCVCARVCHCVHVCMHTCGIRQDNWLAGGS